MTLSANESIMRSRKYNNQLKRPAGETDLNNMVEEYTCIHLQHLKNIFSRIMMNERSITLESSKGESRTFLIALHRQWTACLAVRQTILDGF
eukprot:scaffold592176_cov18-Prasinocladus_malaysianus.AAC.1